MSLRSVIWAVAPYIVAAIFAATTILAIKVGTGWYPVLHEEIWFARNPAGSPARVAEWFDFWIGIVFAMAVAGVAVWALLRRLPAIKSRCDGLLAYLVYGASSFGLLSFALVFGIGHFEGEFVHGESNLRTATTAAREYAFAGAGWGLIFWLATIIRREEKMA